MSKLAVVALVAACGRIGFDPLPGGGGGGGPSDGKKPIDTPAGGSDAPGGGDAPVTACTYAMPVSVGKVTVSTCGGHDLIDGCGPAGTQEVVFAFTDPVGGGHNFAAYDTGTMNVSNSTGVANAACNAVGMCAGILGTSVGAGQTIYLVVEATSGGCTTIDFSVM